MDYRVKTQNTLVGIVLLCCITCQLLGCKPYTDPLIEARALVPIGTPRDETIKILSARSWYYQDCTRGGGGSDLFFFGSHKYEKAFIVIVNYNGSHRSGFTVGAIGSLENYAWHAPYADCIDQSRFDK
jgi:hypothetical protein